LPDHQAPTVDAAETAAAPEAPQPEQAEAAEPVPDLAQARSDQEPDGGDAQTSVSARTPETVQIGAEAQAAPAFEAVGAAVATEAQSAPAADIAAPPAPVAATEPDLIEVWHPGGRSADRRGQRRPSRRPRRDGGRLPEKGPDAELQVATPAADGAAPMSENAAAAASEPASEAEKPAERHRRRRRHGPPPGAPGEFRRDRGDAGERGERVGERQGDRSGQRLERSRGERPYFAKDRSEPKERVRDYAPRRERDKQPDPDSPFAKLAALKAQLEANAKERR
jgi:ATP-dependent RNA helicase SUPV3L1/SUV3